MSASKKNDYVYRNFHYEEHENEESKIYHASYNGNLETINIRRNQITRIVADGEKFLVYVGKSAAPYKIFPGAEKERKFLLKEWKEFIGDQ
jgi:hypothetical protein